MFTFFAKLLFWESGFSMRLGTNLLSHRLSLTNLHIIYLAYALIITLKSGDIETNHGPVSDPINSLSVCHWNLNSVWVDDFIKLAHIVAFLAIHKFDIICLSETFLDSSFPADDPRIMLNNYNLLRCDHPSDTKKGGVCIYFKDHLSLIRKTGITRLSECLVCELQFGTKKRIIALLYRSQSQTTDAFKRSFEETIININNASPYISILIGDFNARTSDWWVDDINNSCGIDIDEIKTNLGLYPIIDSYSSNMFILYSPLLH